MTDRLAELRRQRALLAEHLAWLDREIAALTPPGGTPPTTTISASPALDSTTVLAAVTAQPPAAAKPIEAAETPLPSLPETRPADIRQDVRRGCLLYFVLATLVVIAGGALLVWGSRAYNAAHPAPPPHAEAP